MRVILPFKTVLPQVPPTGEPGKWFYLTQMKDVLTTYKEVKVVPLSYTEVEVDEDEMFFMLGEMGKIPWDVITDLAIDIQNSVLPTPKISFNYLFMESDTAILDDEVPLDWRNSGDAENRVLFRDWALAGDNSQPFATSLDGTRVILRLHLQGVPIETDELLILKQFTVDSLRNAVLLNKGEMVNKTSSPVYREE